MSDVNQAGRLEGHDIEEYNQIVDPWKVNLHQTETGRFDGRLEFVQFNGILLYREHWSRSILATGATPKGYFMLGGTLSPKNRTTWCDQVLDVYRPNVLKFRVIIVAKPKTIVNGPIILLGT